MSGSDNSESRRRNLFFHKHKELKIFGIFCLCILVVFFQNCEQFTPIESTKTTGTSTTVTGAANQSSQDPAANTPQNTDAVQVNQEEELRKKIEECSTLIGKPAISALSSASVTVLSGLAAGAGDQGSGNISVTVADKGVLNPTRAKELLCPIISTVRVRLVLDNANYTNQISYAINSLGNQAVPTDPVEYQNALKSLLENSIRANGNTKTLDEAATSSTFSFSPSRGSDLSLRCAAGVAWYSVVLRTEVSATGGKMVDSEPLMIKANLANNCWKESRLMVDHTLPRLVQYGAKGAISGNRAVVLAPKENSPTGVLEVGTAYVFEKVNGNWIYSAQFQIQDAVARDTLNSVALSGDRIVVSSKYRDGNKGAVFVFGKTNSSWTLQQHIAPPTTQGSQEFGHALAVNGNYLFVSAPNLNSSGAVYVYELVSGSFTLKQTLSDNSGGSYKGFGMSLASEGTLLAVGAPQAVLHESERAGEVHLFSLSNSVWGFSKILAPAGTAAKLGMGFGAAVAVRAGQILVGAPAFYNSDTDVNRGSAFYYANSSGTPVMLTGESSDSLYGHSVSIATAGILIGAPYKDSRAGQVYFYVTADISSKKITRRHFSEVNTAQDNFGSFIDVSGSDVLVGARGKSSPNTAAGAAYIHVMK